nr:immunoglobulin heavy chain junction region [Mus musculus]
CTTGTWYFDVW